MNAESPHLHSPAGAAVNGEELPLIPFRRTLLLKHALFVSTVVLMTAGILSYTGYIFARQILRKHIDDRLTVVATDCRRLLEIHSLQQVEAISLVASRTHLRQLVAAVGNSDESQKGIVPNAFRDQAEAILRDAREGSYSLLEIWITDRQGTVIASTSDPLFGQSFAEHPAFREGRRRSTAATIEWIDSRRVGYLSAPLRNSESEEVGVVMALVDMSSLVDILTERTGLGETGELLLGRLDGHQIRYLLPRQNHVLHGSMPIADAPAMTRAARGSTGFMHTQDYRGINVLASYQPVAYDPFGNAKWGLEAKMDEDEAYAPIHRLRMTLIALQAVLLCAGVGASWWVTRRLTRPILRVAGTAEAVARGNLRARIDVASRDEIGMLADVMNRMIGILSDARERLELRVIERTHELQLAQENLRQTVRRMRQIVDTSYDAFVAMDAEGRIIDWNSQAEATFGWPRNEALGKTVAEMIIPPELREAHREGLANFLATGTGPMLNTRLELPAQHQDGRQIPVELTITAVPEGDTYVFAAFCHDISERKKAEQKIRTTTRDLMRSNEQLEQFAYVASHDLQEPLRAVSGYCQLLERRYRGKLDARADEFIDQIVQGATRMQALISGLLAYSRVSTRGKPFQRIDTELVFHRVIANLSALIDETGAIVTHDPLPQIVADETQFLQLMQNLVGNALKYRGPKPPEVHVSAKQVGEEWEFAVRDNGIGIAPEHYERIFQMFQRLHTREEYPGTGIGLAVCKRIVERHGGRIWLQSQPGEGATFLFTIPLRRDYEESQSNEGEVGHEYQQTGIGASHRNPAG